MAQSIVFNNATYIIPDVGESSWGQNLTNFFVAIPSGCYQLSGGTAPLTADLSFGTNYGIFAKYLTSTTSTPATAGVVRLAKTDVIEWRNNANGGNLPLSIDSSDNLLWNGDIVATSGSSPVLSIAGTSNEITASAATGNVTLSIPSTFIAPGSIAATTTLAGTAATLSAATNQLILGTTHTTTIDSVAPSASRVYTIPDAGGSANVVLDTGNYTIGGTWSFTNSVTLASSKAIIFTDNSTNTVTLKATNSTTSWTLSLPTGHGTNGFFLQTDGSGNTSWAAGGSGSVSSGTAGNLTLYPSSSNSVSDTYIQNSQNITIGIATQASRSAGLAITIPNPGNAVTTVNIVLDKGNYTMAGVYTFSGGAGAITMSSSTIAMGSNKITGLAAATTSGDALSYGQSGASLSGLAVGSAKITALANGTAATDAMAYGQLKVIQIITATSTTVFSTSSGSFQTTNLTASITPTSSSNKILILVSSPVQGFDGAVDTFVTLARGGSNIGAGNGMAEFYNEAGIGTNENISQCSICYIDSPATTSSTTYATQIRNGSSKTVTFGTSTVTQNIILMEVVA